MAFPLVDSSRRRPRNSSLFASLLLVASLACGGGTSEPRQETVNYPVPTLTGVNPSLIVAGSGATTLTVSGTGFVALSQARWNGADRVTHHQSATSMTVDLPASDLAAVTIGKLTVFNGAPGGGTSAGIDVPVGYPKPQITAISPTTAPIQSGSGALSITVTGAGFVPQSIVRLGVNDLGVSVTSATQLVVSVPNSYLGTSGAGRPTRLTSGSSMPCPRWPRRFPTRASWDRTSRSRSPARASGRVRACSGTARIDRRRS